MRKTVFVCLLLCTGMIFTTVFAQRNVTAIRDSLKAQFSQVQDFTADVQLSLNMTAIRMPRKKIRLYFMQPDRFKIEAKGFALVPQYGLPLSPETLFNALSDVIIITDPEQQKGMIRLRGQLQIRDENRHIWNFTRKQRRNLIMDILVDTDKWIIHQFDIYRGEDRIIHVQTRFVEPLTGIYLPEETLITIRIPEELMDVQPDMPFEEEATTQEGQLIMKFQDYYLNQGLEESLFMEEPE